MTTPPALDLWVHVEQPTLRARCTQMLRAAADSGQLATYLPWFAVNVVPSQSQQGLLDELNRRFQAGGNATAIVLSDRLSEPSRTDGELHEPTSWARELIVTFQDRLFGTLSLTDRYRRIQDIDRTLRDGFESRELLETLALVAERLTYVRRPPPRQQAWPLVVRLIRTEAELEQYFSLRHRVYRVMGYLDPRIEYASSGMEIDGFDLTALHVGAFERTAQGEKLVGTARVVSVRPLDDRYERWTRRLARNDPSLKTRVTSWVPQLQLPIFYSMKLEESYRHLLTQEPVCGELSRVVVDNAYRGTGLSTALARFAVLAAVERGVGRLFLECLHLHEGLYRKLGFRTMAGMSGRVPLVNRTMIAMEMTPDAVQSLRGEEAAQRQLQLIRDRGYLCVCRFEQCFRDRPEPQLQRCPSTRP